MTTAELQIRIANLERSIAVLRDRSSTAAKALEARLRVFKRIARRRK